MLDGLSENLLGGAYIKCMDISLLILYTLLGRFEGNQAKLKAEGLLTSHAFTDAPSDLARHLICHDNDLTWSWCQHAVGSSHSLTLQPISVYGYMHDD